MIPRLTQRWMVPTVLLLVLTLLRGLFEDWSFTFDKLVNSFGSPGTSVGDAVTSSFTSDADVSFPTAIDLAASLNHEARIDWSMYNITEEMPEARLAYGLFASGSEEVAALGRLLVEIYCPTDLYVVHLDKKTPEGGKEELEKIWRSLSPPPAKDLVFLEPPLNISWGGATMLLAQLWALGRAVQADSDWDYWINLSASHMPLLTPRELHLVLRVPWVLNASFLEGHPYEIAAGQPDRRNTFHDDELLFRKSVRRRKATDPLAHGGRQAVRPHPTLFRVWKGGLWLVLHRSFAEYVHRSPDNVARSLLAYFSGFKIPDESYFQSVACHFRPSAFPIFNASLHYVTPFRGAHPAPMTARRLTEAVLSGNLFARKFPTADGVSAGAEGTVDLLERYLKEGEANETLADARMARAVAHLQSALPLCPPGAAVDAGRDGDVTTRADSAAEMDAVAGIGSDALLLRLRASVSERGLDDVNTNSGVLGVAAASSDGEEGNIEATSR